jgi:hypothetical protein
LEAMHTPFLRLGNLGRLKILFLLRIMVEYPHYINAAS